LCKLLKSLHPETLGLHRKKKCFDLYDVSTLDFTTFHDSGRYFYSSLPYRSAEAPRLLDGFTPICLNLTSTVH